MDNKTLLTEMREAYSTLNAEYFGGRLPKCFFYVANLTREKWHGYHHTRKDSKHKIVFDSKTEWTLGLIYEIMAHEMIHAAQKESPSANIQNEIHGRFFQRNHVRIFGHKYIRG